MLSFFSLTGPALSLSDTLHDPVRITVGGVGEANSDVTQLMPIFRAEADKWPWLMSNLPRFCVEGSVLIFVSRRGLIDELNNTLNASSYPGLFFHLLFLFFKIFFFSFPPFRWILPDS